MNVTFTIFKYYKQSIQFEVCIKYSIWFYKDINEIFNKSKTIHIEYYIEIL